MKFKFTRHFTGEPHVKSNFTLSFTGKPHVTFNFTLLAWANAWTNGKLWGQLQVPYALYFGVMRVFSTDTLLDARQRNPNRCQDQMAQMA